MPKKSFQVEIVGAGVSPESTRVSDLAAFVSNLEKSILDTASFHGVELPDDAVVSLVDIEEGSNLLTLAVATVAVAAVSSVVTSVHRDRYDQLPLTAHEALHQISNQAAARGWAINFREDAEGHVPPTTISAEHPVPAPAVQLVTGSTTIYGRCLTVGGATRPRVQIRLSNGNLLHLDVSEDTAKVLARSLYENVVVVGEARWRPNDWALVEFRVSTLAPYQDTEPTVGFERMAADVAGAWDGVDALAYTENLRGGR